MHGVTETHVYNSFGAETLSCARKRLGFCDQTVVALLLGKSLVHCGESTSQSHHKYEDQLHAMSNRCRTALGRASQVVTIGFTSPTYLSKITFVDFNVRSGAMRTN